MSPEVRLLVGAISTTVLLTLGVVLVGSESMVPGALALALGLYRGFFVVRGTWAWITPDGEDD